MDKLLRGGGEFVANVAPATVLYATFVRADRPGSVLTNIDESDLAGDPRIKLVLSHRNIVEVLDRLKTSTGSAHQEARVILGMDKFLYLREPIALIVATSAPAALDGAERLAAEFAESDVAGDLTLVDWYLGDQGQTKTVIDAADHQLTVTLRVPRISATPMEPAGAIAQWDPLWNRLELIAPTQGVHRVRDEICEMLGIPIAGLRVSNGDVGGSLYVKQNGMGRREACGLGLSPHGQIEIKVGSQSNGQGHEQTFENLTARILEIDTTDVVLLPGDTDALPSGTGTGGSAALTTTGAAVIIGAQALRAKVMELAAERLEVAPGDIFYKEGICTVSGTDLSIGLKELAADEPIRERAVAGGVQEITFTTTVGCHTAWVSVDTETGEVRLRGYASYDDVGNVLEPALLDAQIHGGAAQGIGQALGEQMVYDPESGQLLTASFMDYWIARADDLPFFEPRHGNTVASNPLGTRGVGEAGSIPASAVVANAVADALAPLAMDTLDLPLTPNRVWAALQPKAL